MATALRCLAGLGAALLAALAAPALAAGRADFEQQVLDLINAYRATHGGRALVIDSRLRASALAHSNDMAVQRCFQHDSCDGTGWASRIHRHYPPAAVSEVVAAGHATPQAVVAAWAASPTHRPILKGQSWSAIGVGYVADPASPWLHYWTVDFGSQPPAATEAGAPPRVAQGPAQTEDHAPVASTRGR